MKPLQALILQLFVCIPYGWKGILRSSTITTEIKAPFKNSILFYAFSRTNFMIRGNPSSDSHLNLLGWHS